MQQWSRYFYSLFNQKNNANIREYLSILLKYREKIEGENRNLPYINKTRSQPKQCAREQSSCTL